MDNPYARPLIVEAFDPLERLHWPSLALKAVGAFGIAVCALSFLHEFVKWVFRIGFGPAFDFFYHFSHIAVFFGFFIVQGLIFVGSIEMKQLKSYKLALGASIAAMIPCLSPCFINSFFANWWFYYVILAPFYFAPAPVGAWCVWVLTREDIRNAFED